MSAAASSVLANTISASLTDAQRVLLSSSSAALDAEILLAHILSKPRSYFHTWPEQTLSAAQQIQFAALIARRATGEPVAYLTGRREFWSLELRVTPDTLIPRPETELVVELALQHIPEHAAWRIADIGTGSGAIAIAIASERPNCRIIATDISAGALAIARNNAEHLGILNIGFRAGDESWCTPLQGLAFDMVVSNPPYISTDAPRLMSDELLRFEPRLALLGGSDGLDHLRSIAAQVRPHLRAGGWLILEHGFDQGPQMVQLLTEFGYHHVADHPDLAGHDRVTVAQYG